MKTKKFPRAFLLVLPAIAAVSAAFFPAVCSPEAPVSITEALEYHEEYTPKNFSAETEYAPVGTMQLLSNTAPEAAKKDRIYCVPYENGRIRYYYNQRYRSDYNYIHDYLEEHYNTNLRIEYTFSDGETVDLSSLPVPDHRELKEYLEITLKLIPESSGSRLKGIVCTGDPEFLENVKTLYITNGNISDMSFMENLDYLSMAYFIRCRLNDVSAPKLSLWLDRITFEECGEVDVSFIPEIAEKKYPIEIFLDGNIIRDLSPLAPLNIQKLGLSDTEGSDYSTIKGFVARYIMLDGNNITDLSFLKENRIGTLELGNNNISDWSALLDIDGLVFVWTHDNPVTIPENREEYDKKGITIADTTDYAYPYA